VAERVAHWLAGLGMFFDHPILGVGIGNYAAVYAQYQVAPVWQYALGHAHNYYINMAAEAGVIGLAAYLFFLGSTLWLCIRLWRTASSPLGRVIGLGALGVVLTTAVQGIFDNVFVHGMEVQIALVLALVGLAERYETEADQGVGEAVTAWPPDRAATVTVRAGGRAKETR
jgi:O-antigen ligase